jgi:hypothetical protein
METQKNDTANAELDDFFIIFAHTTWWHLEKWIEAGELSVMPYLRANFDEQGGHQVQFDHLKDFGPLLKDHLQDLLSMAKAQLCVQKHLEAGMWPISKNGTDEDIHQQGMLALIIPLAESCQPLQPWPFIPPTDEQILEVYHRSRAGWGDADSHFTITFPLLNFSSDLEQPELLGRHLSLAPLSSTDKTFLWNEDAKLFSLSPPPMDATTFSLLQWKLAGTFSSSKKEDASDMSATRQEALNELGDILSAMRLLKGGNVGAPAIYQKRLEPVFWEGTRMCHPLTQTRSFPPALVPYEVRVSDIVPLRDLIDTLQQARLEQPSGSPLYGNLSIGLRRFNQSYERTILEDQLIDLTIALESTLLFKLKEELTYRLAVRGIVLLADAEAPWEPQKSRALLTTMYDVRSLIVHNGQQLSDKEILNKIRKLEMQPQDFLQQCEQIVRDVLKAYVRYRAKGQSVEQVNKGLEARITTGLGVQMPLADVSQQP